MLISRDYEGSTLDAGQQTQRMKRSGMRWRIVGGQAVLTFRALIKSGRFERAWKAIIGATDTPANDNISPRAAAMAIAA